MFQDIQGIYLEKKYDQFKFNYKIYNLENKFIEHVIRTFNEDKKNLGVLLNGLKGTGKTVTAQKLANETGLPIIMINTNFEKAMIQFLSHLKQDIVVLFDEYDKNFSSDSTDLLHIMDGVIKSDYKRMFILTSNENSVNKYMMERPSRIRYIKTFGDLPLDTICEIVDDFLIHKEYRDDVITFVSSLEIITVDILKEVVKEVNIHNVAPETFKSIFNVKTAKLHYDLSLTTGPNFEQKFLLLTSTTLNRVPFYNNKNIGSSFYLDYDYDSNYIGEISNVHDKEIIQIELENNMDRHIAKILGLEDKSILLYVNLHVKARPSYHKSTENYFSRRYVNLTSDFIKNPEKYLDFIDVYVYDEDTDEKVLFDRQKALVLAEKYKLDQKNERIKESQLSKIKDVAENIVQDGAYFQNYEQKR
jgi:hypothetical protein